MASIIQNKSRDFAIRIINCYKYLVEQKHELIMSKQLLRCGTSIGANSRESKNAQSRMDFLNKINIALKEADETEYWLDIIHTTGFLDDDSIVEKYRSCPNIHYHGKLAYEDYLEVFHRASFQLSTRDPNSAENQCNFPSKVMEALLHNRIVVSTIKYPQLKGVLCVKVSHEVEEFIKDIRKISNLPMTELMRYANQSEVVRRNFNANVWSQTMTVIEDNGRIESFA